MTTDPNAAPRRNALILAAAMAFNGSAPAIAISLGGLAGLHLLGPDKSLATAPVTGYNIGVALAALPAALYMARVGRRVGFMSGAAVGVLGAFVACFALMQHSFWLFAFGLLLSGMGTSFGQQYRFAAADEGTEDFKPKAISWVLAGGVFAAILGPQTAINFRDSMEGVPFAGAFLASAGLVGIAGIILSFLRFQKPKPRAEQGPYTGRPLMDIMGQPKFVVAVLCAVGSYSLMAFVMTAAPLAMAICGHTINDSTNGIMFHVIAMFAPSFFTGHLIARFGKMQIIGSGFIILALCAIVALQGISVAHFWIALVLLGVGWNFGFIGATALLTESYRPEEKSRAQGANDLILFSCVAFASLMSGQVLNSVGWDVLNWIVFPIVMVCLLSLLWLDLTTKRQTVS